MPEVAAKRQAVDVRAERRPAEKEEGRVGSVSAGLHQPPQTYGAGPARTGAKRRKNPAAHGRQHGSWLLETRPVPVLVDHDAAKEIGRVNKLMPFDDTDGRWAARAFVIDTETMVIPALPEAGIDETTWILARWSVRD